MARPSRCGVQLTKIVQIIVERIFAERTVISSNSELILMKTYISGPISKNPRSKKEKNAVPGTVIHLKFSTIWN